MGLYLPTPRRFDVDLPLVAQIKAASLSEAGAGPVDMASASSTSSTQDPSSNDPASTGTASSINVWKWDRTQGASTFPLQPASYALAGVDLGSTVLSAALKPLGFDPSIQTIWVLEALVYYLPLQAAGQLWEALAQLCPAGSVQIVTCVDAELLEASRSRVPAGHVFANLWSVPTPLSWLEYCCLHLP
jgi:O-methyltransferase involved in polyketide biosynthesis